MPLACSTLRLTMPQPPHSIQPVPPQVRQASSAPRQTKQRKSSSALGSVNGKYDGRSRVSRPSPNSSAMNRSSVPRRCAMVRPSSIASPSTWWNTGVCVASSSSVRNVLPGQMT